MRTTRVFPNLSVPDIDRASEFYVDYLGLSSEEFNLGWVARYSSPDGRAVVQLVTRDATAPEDSLISAAVGGEAALGRRHVAILEAGEEHVVVAPPGGDHVEHSGVRVAHIHGPPAGAARFGRRRDVQDVAEMDGNVAWIGVDSDYRQRLVAPRRG
jgi:catechol 2,3-dioxygenase-like lactoylglutathione lyase family enzyme